MSNLTVGNSIEQCFKDFSASINGTQVDFNGELYTAMDLRMKNGQWMVDLYPLDDCDQPQSTEEACHVTVV